MGNNFRGFLEKRNDALDNAAYQLALLMLNGQNADDPEQALPWNMEIVGRILENTASVLDRAGYPPCWPYYEEETPCVWTQSCAKKVCPFKGSGQKEV